MERRGTHASEAIGGAGRRRLGRTAPRTLKDPRGPERAVRPYRTSLGGEELRRAADRPWRGAEPPPYRTAGMCRL